MKKSIIVCLALCVTFLSKGLFADGWGTANLNKKVQLALAADSIVQLSIDAGAGDLKITGVADQSEITVFAKVLGDNVSDDDYVLSLEKKGDKALLIAQFNDNTYNSERIYL
jgi:hypothetical protein